MAKREEFVQNGEAREVTQLACWIAALLELEKSGAEAPGVEG